MLPSGTRVLTTTGFKNIEDINESDYLYSLEKDTNYLVPSKVLSNIRTFENLSKFSNKRVEIVCSDELGFQGWRRSKSKASSKSVPCDFKVGSCTQEHNAIISYPVIQGDRDIGHYNAELLGYLASDGYWSWSKKSNKTSSSNGVKKAVECSLSQAEHKFKDEIIKLLDILQAEYSVYKKESSNKNKVYGFSLSSPWTREYLQNIFTERLDKHEVKWDEFVLSLDDKNFESFYKGFYNGDGTLGYNQIAQNTGNIHDGVVASMIRIGKGVVSINRRKNGQRCEVVRMHNRCHITMQEFSRETAGDYECYKPVTSLGSCVIMQPRFIGTVLTT